MEENPYISPECMNDRHRELCLSQDRCNCSCHNPLRPKIDLDKEKPQRPGTRVTTA
jgi:hypothetical protein